MLLRYKIIFKLSCKVLNIVLICREPEKLRLSQSSLWEDKYNTSPVFLTSGRLGKFWTGIGARALKELRFCSWESIFLSWRDTGHRFQSCHDYGSCILKISSLCFLYHCSISFLTVLFCCMMAFCLLWPISLKPMYKISYFLVHGLDTSH